MVYNIEYLEEAEQELKKLPKKHIEQVLKKIDLLESFETATGVKKLQGTREYPLYRIRSGDYRIIFTVEADRVVVLIVRIGHRKDIYKKLK